MSNLGLKYLGRSSIMANLVSLIIKGVSGDSSFGTVLSKLGPKLLNLELRSCLGAY